MALLLRLALAGATAACTLQEADAARILLSAGSGVGSTAAVVAEAYAHFLRTLGDARDADALGFQQRLALFRKQQEAVRQHNAQPHRSWTAALNRFADYTEEEFHALLGHKPSRISSSRSAVASSSSFLEEQPQQALAAAVDWRSSLNSTADVKDQGSCGSCWAVAAVGAIEAHAEKVGNVRPLSFEQLVDCVPNPKQCGGQGGCKGATSELAFAWVSKNGLAAAADYTGYLSGVEGICKTNGQPAVHAEGFTQLAVNKLQPLMDALANKGPVVVSVDASRWSMYSDGVFNGCARDATVNHAVMMVGYGRDVQRGMDYWLIRNSWGRGWGEAGYIRIQRHSGDVDDWDAGYCGTDNKPLDGVGCKGGPSNITVCGMCGILSDSSFPVGLRTAAALAR